MQLVIFSESISEAKPWCKFGGKEINRGNKDANVRLSVHLREESEELHLWCCEVRSAECSNSMCVRIINPECRCGYGRSAGYKVSGYKTTLGKRKMICIKQAEL